MTFPRERIVLMIGGGAGLFTFASGAMLPSVIRVPAGFVNGEYATSGPGAGAWIALLGAAVGAALAAGGLALAVFHVIDVRRGDGGGPPDAPERVYDLR